MAALDPAPSEYLATAALVSPSRKRKSEATYQPYTHTTKGVSSSTSSTKLHNGNGTSSNHHTSATISSSSNGNGTNCKTSNEFGCNGSRVQYLVSWAEIFMKVIYYNLRWHLGHLCCICMYCWTPTIYLDEKRIISSDLRNSYATIYVLSSILIDRLKCCSWQNWNILFIEKIHKILRSFLGQVYNEFRDKTDASLSDSIFSRQPFRSQQYLFNFG